MAAGWLRSFVDERFMPRTSPGRGWFLFLAVAAIGLCGSCSSGPPGGGSTKANKTVGVSVLTLGNPFFRVIGDHLTAELEKAGYKAVVVAGEFDVAKQQQQVRDFIVNKYAAIVLCPCNSKGIGPVIQEANKAGIPVFTADIACLAPGAKIVSHIASDNLGGGKQAAEAMIEALGEAGGKVVILDYKDAESCLLRVQGFKEVIEQYNKGRATGRIEIVAELPGDGKKDKGDRSAQDALIGHPDLAGIFAINDPSALGALAALQRAGKADQVKIVAFDGQKEGKEAIRDGKIYADPIQHPDKIGGETAKSILKYFAGEELPAEQLIPTALYRKADAVDDPELK
jgi:ribose transport system substrate-binding protein